MKCTCSVYANEPNRWCEKHGKVIGYVGLSFMISGKPKTYRSLMRAIIAAYPNSYPKS